MEIKIKYHNKNIDKIEKIPTGDWIDLRCSETTILKQGDYKLIPLGVSIQLPEGYEAHVAPRSSTFKKWGIIQTNSIGIIDESYKGNDDQWMMPVLAMRDTIIEENDRICQFRIFNKMPSLLHITVVENLDNPNRQGFGSTGIK